MVHTVLKCQQKTVEWKNRSEKGILSKKIAEIKSYATGAISLG
jgi:hypothetical protein